MIINFDDGLNEFRRQLVCGEVYSRIPGKNEEALAMISVYKFGNPKAKLEAQRWLKADAVGNIAAYLKEQLADQEHITVLA